MGVRNPKLGRTNVIRMRCLYAQREKHVMRAKKRAKKAIMKVHVMFSIAWIVFCVSDDEIGIFH